MKRLEARHPGLCQRVNAMFEAFATIDAVTQMIRSEYGERLSHTTIWKYKRQCWSAERKRLQATRAALFAFAELKSEGRT
jgi:hypothetical protein